MPSTFPSDRAGSTNAELKASDSSSNPYLALGGLLAAGLDGVTRKLEPGEPVLVDPAPCPRVSGASAGSSGTRPPCARRSISWSATPCSCRALGPTWARAYLAVKRSEAEAFGREDEAFETKHHFWKF